MSERWEMSSTMTVCAKTGGGTRPHPAPGLGPKEGLHWVIGDEVLADAQVLYAA